MESKLYSQRDNVLAQLDLVLNKNISDSGVSGIVNQAVDLFTELSKIESTIETLTIIKNGNEKPDQFTKQVGEITAALQEQFSQIKENNNLENHDNNS